MLATRLIEHKARIGSRLLEYTSCKRKYSDRISTIMQMRNGIVYLFVITGPHLTNACGFSSV
jgi:hypothetical protein